MAKERRRHQGEGEGLRQGSDDARVGAELEEAEAVEEVVGGEVELQRRVAVHVLEGGLIVALVLGVVDGLA